MMRVRGFTQDDGHIFCTEDQLQDECADFTALLQKVYADFGFTEILYKVRSEEHTSELQSLMRISYAVFCLKKKKPIIKVSYMNCTTKNTTHSTITIKRLSQ